MCQRIEPERVPWKKLKKEYGPLLGLVQQVIGVVPYCDPFLAIWPAGFRTYNALVPALFNMPSLLMGRTGRRIKPLVGLAAYTSSRAAACMYCSAHTCAFALKRGASAEAVAGNYGEAEAAAAAVGDALGHVPARLTRRHLDEMGKYVENEMEVQWVAYAGVMMGFLNKFMDVMGVELEAESVNMVRSIIEPTGWTVGKHAAEDQYPDEVVEATVDSFGTYVRILRHAPGAVRLEWRWTRKIPDDNVGAKEFLEREVGFSFAVVDHIGPARVLKAVVAILRDNMSAEQSVLGLDAKCLAAIIFAMTVRNDRLEADALRLTKELAPACGADVIDGVLAYASSLASEDRTSDPPPACLEGKLRAAVVLARAASPSPSLVQDEVVEDATKELSAEQIVELVTWLSVLQMLHRFDIYHFVRGDMTTDGSSGHRS
jgi:alkylhydroperoxidase family enzyme